MHSHNENWSASNEQTLARYGLVIRGGLALYSEKMRGRILALIRVSAHCGKSSLVNGRIRCAIYHRNNIVNYSA